MLRGERFRRTQWLFLVRDHSPRPRDFIPQCDSARARSTIGYGLAAVAALLPLTVRPAAAQSPRTITVSATGEARSRPTQVVIPVRCTAAAELSGDALTKFRDTTRRIVEACGGLGIDGLSISAEGFAVGQASDGQNPLIAIQDGGQAKPPQVQLSRTVQVKIPIAPEVTEDQLLEAIAKVLDAAQDGGAALPAGPTPNAMLAMMAGQAGGNGIRFVIEEGGPLRAQAYQSAIEAAREQARQLASLAGSRLGEVLDIDEREPAASPNESPQASMIRAVYGIAASQDDSLSSPQFQEVTVRVGVRMRFALENQ